MALVICLTASSDNSFCTLSIAWRAFTCRASSISDVVWPPCWNADSVRGWFEGWFVLCEVLRHATLVTSSKALFSTKCTQDLCINNLLTIILIPEETSGVVFVRELVSTDTHVGSTSKLASTDTRIEMSVL